MTALTQAQLVAQMVAQLRTFDPSVSAEIGTPERKVIETVAEGIAEAQIDINLLGGALDLDSKFGTDLVAFVGLFGFGRQSGAFATGFVDFGRLTPSAYNIVIPSATQVQATIATSDSGPTNSIIFQTTSSVTLIAGQTSVTAPVQALLAGAQGNVAANTITQFANVGAPILGITSINNPLPTANGADTESDPELKVRFRNTVFRNVSGTEDQFMALAIATQFSTKANVLGPISRYREYVQVPLADDSQVEYPTVAITASATTDDPLLTSVVPSTGPSQGTPAIGQIITGTGIPANTTIIDIESDIYTLSADFTGTTGSGLSFTLQTGQPPDETGGGTSGNWTTLPSNNPYAKYIYLNVPYFLSNGAGGAATLFYRQDTDFTLNAPPSDAGDTYREFHEGGGPDIEDPVLTPYNPNVTLFNVYTGADADVTVPRPSDVLLLEYSYLSAESRNDIRRNITNCVDVYVNGTNPTTATAVIPPPRGGVNLFSANPIDKFYHLNFRRIGKPDVAPTVGHILTTLFWQPVIGLPSQIVIGDNTYLLDTHYWAVEDKTLLGNTVRTRNGIEWAPTANGQTGGDPDGGPYTGDPIVSTGASSLTIPGYIYDQNIITLQSALDNNKQITTDALAHRATIRYFKLDLTVVYGRGASVASTNTAIAAAIRNFFDGQYFGSIIQLSDLLSLVRNVSGVQNIRWSNDVIAPSDDESNTLNRVTECDIDGNPRDPAVVFNTDFFFRDSELPAFPAGQLPGDTLPGLILRPRAEGTFNVV